MKRLFWSSLLIKLVLAAFIPIFADEAYYWVWSHHLQLSYFDHPPMVAWLFLLGHFLEPYANCVRFPAVILGQATFALWLLIMSEILPQDELRSERLWCFALLFLFSPFLGAGSIIVTPDIPLLFFWSLAIYVFLRLERDPRGFNYLALGAVLGLCFCSKYNAVLFVPPIFLYLIFERRWREVNWKYVPLTILAGLLFCAPVLIWNYQRNFISFRFQLHHGFHNHAYKPSWAFEYVFTQIGLLFPLIVWAALRAKLPRAARILIYFGWFPFAFFFFSALKSHVEANWTIVGYPAILALAVFYPRIRAFTRIYVAVFGAALIAAIIVMFVPNLRKLSGHVMNAYQYELLAKKLKPYHPLFTQTHQWAAALNYITKKPVYMLRGIDRPDFYDFIPQSKPTGDHFYLLTEPNERMPDWMSKDHWTWHLINIAIPPKFQLLEATRQ